MNKPSFQIGEIVQVLGLDDRIIYESAMITESMRVYRKEFYDVTTKRDVTITGWMYLTDSCEDHFREHQLRRRPPWGLRIFNKWRVVKNDS